MNEESLPSLAAIALMYLLITALAWWFINGQREFEGDSETRRLLAWAQIGSIVWPLLLVALIAGAIIRVVAQVAGAIIGGVQFYWKSAREAWRDATRRGNE